MSYFERYQLTRTLRPVLPNVWDIAVLTIVVGLLAAAAWGTLQMTAPYQVGDAIDIDLSPWALPQYAINTVLRMFIALAFSFLFTFTVAPLAAKNPHAEKFIIPFIDVMQSIPVLGFLAITTVGFIKLFPNSLLGPECAAIFAIFTAQVWNMALSLYQSLKTVPNDLQEAAKMFRLSKWQKFWQIEVPHGTPGLLWNTMMSMSAGWFFVVLSEAIEVNNQDIKLPGIGSYIDKAITESNTQAMIYAIVAMLIIILLYDQLLFRPLLAWSEKFKSEIDAEAVYHESWFYDLLAKTRVLKKFDALWNWIQDRASVIPQRLPKLHLPKRQSFHLPLSKLSLLFWNTLLFGSIIGACVMIAVSIHDEIPLHEIGHVLYLGALTGVKVIVLIVLASLLWIPIGVWVGLNPKASAIVQPLIQIAAAFPANFFYPLAVIVILNYHLNHQIWTMPLMILGTQWYILFNVIAGASEIPKEIKLAATNFKVKGWLWWKRLMLPAIFPFYATGAMAAAGGCWNASIVAEYVKWGDDTIISTGIGSYIEQHTRDGDFPRIALGIGVMCIYVMLFNRLLWQKLYQLAETRFAME